MAKPRRNLKKTTKECPAPQSEAPTLLLTPFSTHLSFRWTLPLSSFTLFLTVIYMLLIHNFMIIYNVLCTFNKYLHQNCIITRAFKQFYFTSVLFSCVTNCSQRHCTFRPLCFQALKRCLNSPQKL